MPTYQYACTECGHAFEQFQSFTDDALTECPACHGRLRKVFNSVGIVFKGSGFYRTDSRAPEKSGANGSAEKGKDKADKSGDKADKSGAKSDTSGSSGKPDSKPAAPSKPKASTAGTAA